MRAASFKSLYQKRPVNESMTAHSCVQGAPDTALGHFGTNPNSMGALALVGSSRCRETPQGHGVSR